MKDPWLWSIVIALIVIFSGVAVATFFDGSSLPEERPVSNAVAGADIRQLASKVDVLNGEVATLRRLILANAREGTKNGTYSLRAAIYYQTISDLSSGTVSISEAGSKIAAAMAGDLELSQLWALVLDDRADVRVFENLLRSKTWASIANAFSLNSVDG